MSEEQVLEYFVGEFRGDFPDVPVADGVDVEAIRGRDPDAMFVTLPIAEVGAISSNGLLYDDALIDSIAEQINVKRPGGIFGHLKDDERSTSFPLPAGLWVGARRFGKTLWAKSYIPPGAARDYVGNLKAVGGQLATSIYGRGKSEKVREGVRRLLSLNLESLDFAPPARAALGLGAVPHVTAEMETQEQEAAMPDKAQIISELTVADIPAALREQIIAEASKQDETSQTIAELEQAVASKEVTIAELERTVAEMRRERVAQAIEEKVAELTSWQVGSEEGKAKLAKLRALLGGQIVARLGSDATVERVAEMAGEAWEDIKPIAETIRDALAGPSAVVRGRVAEMQNTVPALEDTPENRQRALASMGIQV